MHVWMMGCLLYVCNIILFVSCADACLDDGLLVVRLSYYTVCELRGCIYG